MNASHLLARGSASRAARGMNDTLSEMAASIRELREQGDTTPPLSEAVAQEQLPAEAPTNPELSVSGPAPTPPEQTSKIFIQHIVPARTSPVEAQAGDVAEMTREVKAAGMDESGVRHFPSGVPSDRLRNGAGVLSPPRAPDVLKLPAVPDVSVELKAFVSAMAQQQEMTLQALQQVTELCRRQQARVERLSEEVATMGSRMRSQSHRM